MLALFVVLSLAPQDPVAPAPELAAALEALRHGEPGQPEFEAALPRLGDLIASDSVDLVAGGAFLAAEHLRAECVPALLGTLERWDDLGVKARGHVLDALIRLDVHLERGQLPPTPWCEAQSYLLLARDAEIHRDALLRLLDASELEGPERWACAVTLARLRDPRLAGRLLSDDPWPVQVLVRDPGAFVGAGDRRYLRRISCGRPSWPPRVEYVLRLPAADEPLPVAIPALREVSYGSCVRRGDPRTDVQRADWRRRLLGELLGRAPLDLAEDLELDWHGPERFVGGVITHLREQRARIEELARELESRGLLEPAIDVAARTRIRITLRDLREDRSTALPRADLGPDVRWAD